MFDTSDNSLMVYIFGPKKSRPFTVCVHTMVGVGFVVGSLLCNPFLPQQKTTKDVCPSNSTTKQIFDDGDGKIVSNKEAAKVSFSEFQPFCRNGVHQKFMDFLQLHGPT